MFFLVYFKNWLKQKGKKKTIKLFCIKQSSAIAQLLVLEIKYSTTIYAKKKKI